MKATIKLTLIVTCAVLVTMALAGTAPAATNQAIDGGGFPLTDSNTVTVNAATLQLVKQVWVGGTCMASSITTAADPDACGSPETDTVTVPSGTSLEFLIFVRNTSDITITDVRFQDLIDDSAGATGGFTYVVSPATNGITATAVGAVADNETAANIRAAATQGQSDAADGDYVSITDTGGVANNGDRLTVGAVAAQPNAQLDIPANTTFAILVPVTKN